MSLPNHSRLAEIRTWKDGEQLDTCTRGECAVELEAVLNTLASTPDAGDISELKRRVEEVDELTGGRGSTGPSWAYHDGVRDQLLAEIDFLKKQNAELARGTEALARQLQEARDEGWLAAVVEHWNAWARIRQDLFGFVDVVCVKPGESILFVQTTSGSNVNARVEKIRSLEAYNIIKLAGIRVEVHGWARRGARGERKTWTCRIVEM